MKTKGWVAAAITLVMWIAVAGSVIGRIYYQWQWWDLITIVSSLALSVALVMDVAQAVMTAAR